VAGPVVADLELEGVVEAALERLGQDAKRERQLWHSGQQVGVVAGMSWGGGLELGEFFGAGPVLGGQLSEAPLDALPVFLVGLGSPVPSCCSSLVMRFSGGARYR
jgi:hypothetical protein